MIGKILVPTDFSEISYNALILAREIAEKDNAQICVLRMINVPDQTEFDEDGTIISNPSDALQWQAKLIKDAREELNEWLDKCDCNAVRIVDTGDLSNGINTCIINNKIDLVIMGSQGVSGIKEIFSDSTAAMVVNKASVPVLVVKTKTKLSSFSNMAVVSDFNEKENKLPELLLSFIQSFGSHLTLLRINTPSDFLGERKTKTAMKNFELSNNLKVSAQRLYSATSIEIGIREFSEESDTGLLIIGNHGRKGIKHIFMGSKSEELVNHLESPILTYKIH